MNPALGEMLCFDRDGRVAASVIVGDDGVLQIWGDIALARETLRVLAADPAAQPVA